MLQIKAKHQVVFVLLSCLICMDAMAQKRDKYEFYKDFPVYADKLLGQLTYPLAWGNSDIKDFIEWKSAARRKVFECMMTPPPEAKSYDVKVIGEEKREGYTARKLEFNLSDFYRVRAYVLIPDGEGPFPAVNLLHDHGAHLYIGKEKMIRPFDDDSLVLDDADKWVDNLYGGQYFGDYLAKNGYVVFSTDAPMWGERGRAEGVDRSKYDIIAGNMMMYGRNLSAFMTYDDIASTDFLATLPEVDPKRIGCAGCSMGAYRAWMLSALSDKISACAAVCWMITTDVQMTWKYGRKESGGFANCIPALRQYLDYPHIASIACPKPTLFISGTEDKLFKVPGVKKAFKIMHEVWDSQNAGGNLETELWPIPHSCGIEAQQRVLDFFNKKLK
ncbi:alpha/beta hydrolase family protein [Marseilla massiliensis]|uniref:Dienelactone hydrolase family protein n=1 Tax=Marseilla massiliensis TaxID=1841864 RepID=A0A938WSM0_9BACT|nr:alpha/beta hydrolase family protein [Marseilla massiliensis]MBM6673011.1 dienelactone hydrolase family protein [Marseilla massiliensis]